MLSRMQAWQASFGDPQNGDQNFLQYLMGRNAAFQPYAAGDKRYGFNAQASPHSGGGLNRLGYRERDLKAKAMRNGMLRRMKASQKGRYMSSDYLDPENRSY